MQTENGGRKMFKKAATLFAILMLAGPASANDDLARNMGIEPGKYTTAELVQILLAEDRDIAIETVERNRVQWQQAVRAAVAAGQNPTTSTRSAR